MSWKAGEIEGSCGWIPQVTKDPPAGNKRYARKLAIGRATTCLYAIGLRHYSQGTELYLGAGLGASLAMPMASDLPTEESEFGSGFGLALGYDFNRNPRGFGPWKASTTVLLWKMKTSVVSCCCCPSAGSKASARSRSRGRQVQEGSCLTQTRPLPQASSPRTGYGPRLGDPAAPRRGSKQAGKPQVPAARTGKPWYRSWVV